MRRTHAKQSIHTLCTRNLDLKLEVVSIEVIRPIFCCNSGTESLPSL